MFGRNRGTFGLVSRQPLIGSRLSGFPRTGNSYPIRSKSGEKLRGFRGNSSSSKAGETGAKAERAFLFPYAGLVLGLAAVGGAGVPFIYEKYSQINDKDKQMHRREKEDLRGFNEEEQEKGEAKGKSLLLGDLFTSLYATMRSLSLEKFEDFGVARSREKHTEDSKNKSQSSLTPMPTERKGFSRVRLSDILGHEKFGDELTASKEYTRIDKTVIELESRVTSNNNMVSDTLIGEDKIEMLKVYKHNKENLLTTIMHLGPKLCGHPSVIHGGLTAAIFDNMFGVAFLLSKAGLGFTANLNVNYRKPIDFGTTCKMDVRVDRIEGRKVFLSGSLRDYKTEALYADSTCLFVVSKQWQILFLKTLMFLGLGYPIGYSGERNRDKGSGQGEFDNLHELETNKEMYERIDDKYLEKNRAYVDGHLIHDTLNGEGAIETLKVFRKKDDNSIVGITRFGEKMSGFPDMVHGGAMAAVFDNTFGWAFFLAEVGNGHTANLDVNYRTPFPVGSEALLKIRVDKLEGRKVYLKGTLENIDDGTIYADATALFVISKKLTPITRPTTQQVRRNTFRNDSDEKN